jgi:glycerol kinase
MGEPLLLALDQGTTSTRAVLFDARGRSLHSASRPLRQSYPDDGWVEHDAEEIAEACVAVLREVVETSGRPAQDILALGITNQRETTVVWDKATGRPIHPAIVWQDRRTAAACEALRARGAEAEVARITGLLLDPYFSATKIAWILDHVEGARERAARGELLAGTIDTWVIWKLTRGAVHATDATNASRTLLYDLEAQDWSPAMLDLFGVPAGMLPQVRDCAGDFGTLAPEIFGHPAPIRGVAGDQQAALMGQGCVHAGEMKATYGTGCFMLLHTGDRPARSSARLLTTVAARLNGRSTYALEGSIFIAGAAIQWLNDQMGVAGGPQGAEALARKARPDHEVVVVPAFTGLGAPWWDAGARGAVIGLTRDSGLAEIAAATYDACALQTRDLIEAMRQDAPDAFAAGEGGSQPELRIDGGMSQSRWFRQRLADLTGVAVCPAEDHEMTALGAALFAGIGAGLFSDQAAAADCRSSGELAQPTITSQARTEAYQRWLQAVSRTRT